jgi:hypothetical protein
MQGTLVLTILTIQSSYLREMEEPLGNDSGPPDTIQWWIAPTGSWRIRTYAIDHDIHTHAVGNADNLKEVALKSAQEHYGDVIQSQHVIELADCLDRNETARAFRAAGLEPRVEIAAGRFAFWKPDEGRYHTQSQPT